MRYREQPPPADLARVVQAVWTVEGEPGEAMRVVPDACVDLIALGDGGGTILLNGPMPRAEIVTLWQASTTGLRLRPGTLPRIGGIDSLATVRGGSRRIPWQQAGGTPETRLIAFARRLAAQGRLVRHPLVDAALIGAARGSTAALPPMGARRLQRLFALHVGLSPQETFAALRHDELARTLRGAEAPALVDIAAAFGFTDQAHLTHAFRRLAGVPPSSYRREVRGDAFVQDRRGPDPAG